MATTEECLAALERFAHNIAANNEQVKSKVNFDRQLACDITDLKTSFHGRFVEGSLTDIAEGDDPQAHIRMTVGSDDLIALVDGELDFGKAYANGRVKIKASLLDLLKLKNIL